MRSYAWDVVLLAVFVAILVALMVAFDAERDREPAQTRNVTVRAPSSVVGGMGMPGKVGSSGQAFRFGMERNREEGTQDEQ